MNELEQAVHYQKYVARKANKAMKEIQSKIDALENNLENESQIEMLEQAYSCYYNIWDGARKIK